MIAIQCDDRLEVLAQKLAVALSTPRFTVDTHMDPPHGQFATTEVLGFELWLEREANREDCYTLEMSTSILDPTLVEAATDVSEWFSRYVALVSGLGCSSRA
jgi:hypothetical protein